ncbi:MAG: VanW family protein [Thermoanaerobacterales bacterium]|nr:VanW family protein [Thermoanaerobacterales bacterium]
MVPLRPVLETSGVRLWWDGEGVSGSWPGHTLQVIPGTDRAWRDGTPVPLEAPAVSINGVTFIPASFVADLFPVQGGTEPVPVTRFWAGDRTWWAGLMGTPGIIPALPETVPPGETAWFLPALEDHLVKGLLGRVDRELQEATGGAQKLQPDAERTFRLALAACLETATLPTMRRAGNCTINFNPQGAYNNMLNAVKAAGYLNGTVVPPGAVFSFNRTLGPRTAEKGYVVGFAFEDKKHIKALGGGVCRLSTIIYGAVRDAGLPVVERHPHSLPVGYVPPGRDATVSYGGADFKFRNDRPYPLLIEAGGTVRRITVTLWELRGLPPPGPVPEPSWPAPA